MTSTSCCAVAGSFCATIASPETLLSEQVGCFRDRLVRWYDTAPVATRVGAGLLAVPIGLIKPLVFPILVSIGLLLLPVSCLVRCQQKKEVHVCAHLGAGVFCIASIVGTGAFLIITAYYCPLTVSASAVAGVCSLSIVFHVARAMRAPMRKKEEENASPPSPTDSTSSGRRSSFHGESPVD